jgi:hypothetical protein
MNWTLENKTPGGLEAALKPAVFVPNPISRFLAWLKKRRGGSTRNTYDRFLFLLLSEFRRKVQPQVRFLRANLMELVVVMDGRAQSAAREQASHRVRALGRAASAAQADRVRSPGQELELMLGALMQAPTAARPELFESLCGTMRKLTGAVHSMGAQAPASEHAGRLTERTLVESCAD